MRKLRLFILLLLVWLLPGVNAGSKCEGCSESASDDILLNLLKQEKDKGTIPLETYQTLKTKTGNELKDGFYGALKRTDEAGGVVNGAGNVIRQIDDFIPSSGTRLIGNPNKTTTLLGRWEPDMQIIKEKMLPNEFNVGTEFGTVANNNGGFNFLNIETNYNPETFFDNYNKPWLLKAIQRGDDIILATRPTLKTNFVDPTTGKLLGAFAEELKFLVQKNYKPINLTLTEWNTIKTWFL